MYHCRYCKRVKSKKRDGLCVSCQSSKYIGMGIVTILILVTLALFRMILI